MATTETIVELLPINSIIPYALNNKVHTEQQIDRIANSISQFGFNAPIVVDEQNVILAGHGRFAAAKKIGMTAIPVIKKRDLSENQKRAYRIIDNKTSLDTSWDLHNLELEVKILEDLNYPDMETFGFGEIHFDPPPSLDEVKREEEMDEHDSRPSAAQIIITGDSQELEDFHNQLDDMFRGYHTLKARINK